MSGRVGWILGLALFVGPIAGARAQDHGHSVRARDGAPVTSPTEAAGTSPAHAAPLHPDLERARDVLLEVVDLLHKVHVDGTRITRERCLEEAIWALRAHVRDTHLIEGEARERLRSALARVPEGDLDACLAVLDANLPARPGEALALAKVMIRGAISVTNDPFTMLTDPSLASRFANQMTGTPVKSYGLRAREGPGGVTVVDHVFRGTQAFEKGLAAGDVILEVDGRPAYLVPLDELLKRFQSDAKMTLRIHREGFAHAHDVELECRFPREQNVDGDLLPGGVGYVRVNAFIDRTAADLEATVRQLEKQGARALILDVRDNPGGAMDSVAAVARIFLGNDVPVATIERPGSKPEELRTPATGAAPTKLPLLVLVNRGSASASEMVAGALKETGRARILGTRTFGKGVGQSFVPLETLRGWQLLVTTIKYRTPSGHWPQGEGITPTAVVEPFSFTPAEQEEIFRLTAEDAFEHYLAQHAPPSGDALFALARDDEGRAERYPGFDAWMRGLSTTLKPDALRRSLRAAVRSWATQSKGATFHEDLRDDPVLRHAHELLGKELAAAPPPAAPPEPEKDKPGPPPVRRKFFY